MAGCCCENKSLTLYRGYPSEFADVDWLSITFESEPIDLTNFEAQFILGETHREWTDITQGIIINLTDEETGALPVGMNYGTLIVTDTSGNSKPFSTAIPVEVKIWVEGDQELDTYDMTVNALLDNEVQMVIRIETAKVSLDWVNEKIAEHNASEEAHPYIQGLIDEEKTARENADTALHNEIVDEATARENADIGLHNEIVSEATTRYNADNLLHDEIVAEADIRERADIDLRNRINGKQDKLTSENAGVGISIEDVDGNVVISNTQTSAEWGNILGNLTDQTDLWNYLSEIGVLDNLTTTEKSTLVGAINEVNSNALKQSDITTGSANGTIAVKGSDVSVKGLKSAAYTLSTAYATAAQGTKADSALQPTDVIDNTSSTTTNKPLSANMGKSLQDQVDNLKARGRFLALWNCATGLAESNPPSGTYTYQSGDYFIVGVVASAGGTNYRPDGSSYTTGVASITVETAQVDIDDVYYYDGSVWRLQVNTQKEIGFVNIAGSPYDNTNLASALNDKQDEIDSTNKLSADLVDDSTTTNKFVTESDKTNWNSKISGVKVNGTELTPDANYKVDVTVPTESTVSGWGFTKNVGTVTSVNNNTPDSNGNVSLTIPSINTTNNYVPYRSSSTAFSNSTLMYNSSAMAFTGKLHVGSTSPSTYSNFGRFTIYDNTPSQQVTSMALLNYGGGGGCGVAIDMYNTSANSGIPSGRFGLIDNGNYSGYLQLQVKKSGASNNPLLPAMNIVPVPATSSLTTCVAFGKDEFNNVLFDLHKPEEVCSMTDSDKRWSGSGTTYSQNGSNKFNSRLMVAVGDIVYFTAGTEATVTSIVSNTSTHQITVDRTLGSINNQRLYVKKAYFKVTDENYNTKIIINPYGKMGLGTSAPAYDLDVNGTINASTDIKINGSSVALASSVPTETSDLINDSGFVSASYDGTNEMLVLG